MQQVTEPPKDRRFHPLAVARIVDETHDAKSIVFDVPSHLRPTFRYEAGQFLTLEIEHDGAKVRRSYSLASSPACEDEHKVTVKRVAGGRVSNWVNDRLKVGDVVHVMPPEGRFVLGHGETQAPLLLFAGGSGITPVISILKTAMVTTPRTARLIYANRDARSIIFARELSALVERYAARIEVTLRLDDVHGFLDPATVKGFVRSRDVDSYLCGPGPFMDAVERGLVDAGIDRGRIRIEKFISPSDAPKVVAPVVGDVPATIGVTLHKKRVDIPYAKGKSLLRAALDAGLDAPYSCEEGFCGCCAAKLCEGQVTMDADDALTDDEKKRGMILTCQARPKNGAPCSVEYPEGV